MWLLSSSPSSSIENGRSLAMSSYPIRGSSRPSREDLKGIFSLEDLKVYQQIQDLKVFCATSYNLSVLFFGPLEQ